MYEYKYVKIKVIGLIRRPESDYHVIIDQHAREGWRLVQILTPPIGSYGIAPYYELIFEREKNNEINI